MKRKLMILAGYSGVGKTTLTCYCLKHRIPLFGLDNQDSFLGFQIPTRFPEWRIDIKSILANNHWFSTCHLPSLRRMSTKPDCAFIHIDLLGLITNDYLRCPIPQEAEVRYPRSMESLRSHEENVRVISRILHGNFLASWDRLIVNTVYAPYDQTCRQWHAKAWKAEAKKAFFDLAKPEETIHRAAYTSWEAFIASSLPATLLSTRLENDAVKIKRMN